MNADIGSKDKEKEATSLIMRGMKRGIQILESAKDATVTSAKNIGSKASEYYIKVKDAIAKQLPNITDMTPFASVDSVNNLFANTFKNTKIILKHIKTFFVLFVTILILNINTIIEIVKLYAKKASDFITNFGVTAESTDEQDPYFKIFGDYWIQVVKEIYLFLNPIARNHFKDVIVEVVSEMTKNNCPTIDPANKNPMQLFIDNARLGVNLGAFYFFTYSSASASPVVGGVNDNPPAPPSQDNLSVTDPSAPPATDTAPPTPEELNELGKPKINMKKLIENNILLYMLLTGHKQSDTICKHFVEYVNNNLETKLNADPERIDSIHGDKAESEITETTNPIRPVDKPITPVDKPTGGKRKTKTKRRTKKRKTKRR